MAGLSGAQQVKAILAALESKGHLLVLTNCPFCNERDRLELDPQGCTYFCGACGRSGKLECLAAIAEGLFLSRHRESLKLMTTRPGVEKGENGGRNRCR